MYIEISISDFQITQFVENIIKKKRMIIIIGVYYNIHKLYFFTRDKFYNYVQILYLLKFC